jgi:hypothetical protein
MMAPPFFTSSEASFANVHEGQTSTETTILAHLRTRLRSYGQAHLHSPKAMLASSERPQGSRHYF